MQKMLWDYKLKRGWKPKTAEEWIWYLERKIHHDNWRGLKPRVLKKYFPWLKLDPGKKLMVKAYFKKYVR